MSSRLDYAGEQAAITELKGLQQDLQTLKGSRQSINYALITHGYVSQSNLTSDVTAYSIPANTDHWFYIMFQGDGSQPAFYGAQFSAVYVGGTAPANRLSDYQLADANGNYYWWYLSDQNYDDPAHPQRQWEVGVHAGPSGASVYIKFKLLTTCKGAWYSSW